MIDQSINHTVSGTNEKHDKRQLTIKMTTKTKNNAIRSSQTQTGWKKRGGGAGVKYPSQESICKKINNKKGQGERQAGKRAMLSLFALFLAFIFFLFTKPSRQLPKRTFMRHKITSNNNICIHITTASFSLFCSLSPPPLTKINVVSCTCLCYLVVYWCPRTPPLFAADPFAHLELFHEKNIKKTKRENKKKRVRSASCSSRVLYY